MKKRNYVIALAFVLGGLGAHRIYLGDKRGYWFIIAVILWLIFTYLLGWHFLALCINIAIIVNVVRDIIKFIRMTDEQFIAYLTDYRELIEKEFINNINENDYE
jgi:TM2 domain-containing membrane protein YozV